MAGRPAEAFAQEVLPQLEEEIQEDTETGEETQPVPLAQDLSTPIVTVEGRDYLGYLSLPTLGLELPVLAQWNYPNLALAPLLLHRECPDRGPGHCWAQLPPAVWETDRPGGG